MRETPASLVNLEAGGDAYEGGTAGVVTVARVGDLEQGISVEVAASGTATAGSDYMTPITINFAPYQVTANVQVFPLQDGAQEPDETITYTLQPGTGYDVGANPSATITLYDDDTPSVVTITGMANLQEESSPGLFGVYRTGALHQQITVWFMTSGTAMPGMDYQSPMGVTFAPWSTEEYIIVTDIFDTAVEGTETITYSIMSSGIGYVAVTPNSATIDVIDNDVPAEVIGTGTGLRGYYYNYWDETHPNKTLVQNRIDATIGGIATNWGAGSPIPGVVNPDHFHVRWEGEVQAKFTSDYVFRTRSDDGVRVWLNGAMIIDHWSDHGPADKSSDPPISLVAGMKYNILIEYYDRTDNSTIELWWQRVGVAGSEEIIPQTQLYPAALPNAWIGQGTGLMASYVNWDAVAQTWQVERQQVDNEPINHNWGEGSPFPGGVNPDYFQVAWQGQVRPKFDDDYVFQTETDDGVQFLLNGVLLIDDWNLHPVTINRSEPLRLLAGLSYDIMLIYHEHEGTASAKLSWKGGIQTEEVIPTSQLYSAPPAPKAVGGGSGLNATYSWSESPNAKSQAEQPVNINFDWLANSPALGVPADKFTARFVGFVQPRYSGFYTFTTESDDGVMLWVGNRTTNPVYRRLINSWADHSLTTNRGAFFLDAGEKHPIVLQYYENVGDATIKLKWKSEYQAEEIIPVSQLYTTALINGLDGPVLPTELVKPSGTFGDVTTGDKFNLFGPPDKATILTDVPFWRKDSSPILLSPTHVQPYILSGDRYWSGVVPPAAFIGPSGCGPCVGVALLPPEKGMKTYVFHFSFSANIDWGFTKSGFKTDPWGTGAQAVRQGYKAVLCGAEWNSDATQNEGRLHLLKEVRSWLGVHSVPVAAYVPATGFAVDENGWVYWTSKEPGDFER